MLANEHLTSRCPHCERLLGGMRHGIRFGEQAIRIIDAITRAGPDGIGYDELFELTYQDRPVKRTALKGLVMQINKKLEETCDVQISGRGGHYHMTTLLTKRLFQ